MIAVNPSAAFELPLNVGETGLVGTLAVAIIDNQGATVFGPTTAGITENEVDGNPTGNYTALIAAAPADAGQYQTIASTDGSFDPETVFADDLLVTGDAQPTVVPPTVISGGPVLGPCTAWITGADVAACRENPGSDTSIYDDAAVSASMLLFEASGRQFSGLCQQTVRPCPSDCIHWLAAYPGPPYPVWNGWGWGSYGGCAPLSRVKLPGYPVREIVQVKIDGNVIDPDGYRLDGHRWLIRKGDTSGSSIVTRHWPGCSRLDVDDDQPGTFSITYLFGIDPPPVGQQAAAALASAIYDACNSDGDCALPAGVIEVARQGVTIRRVVAAAQALREGSTGIPALDSFLGGYNPSRLARRPAVWSPDMVPYARRVG